MSPWTHVMSAAELDAFYAKTAELDPNFARMQRAFYEAHNAKQLSALAHQAWLTNSGDSYMLARSHKALVEAR